MFEGIFKRKAPAAEEDANKIKLVGAGAAAALAAGTAVHGAIDVYEKMTDPTPAAQVRVEAAPSPEAGPQGAVVTMNHEAGTAQVTIPTQPEKAPE